ncbi:MAG: tetratricopeptide repeat protein [Deltaproteobacteria bacterium]|nr:tetratricopeptide repeat protein [Deltaproteobacteria bacterium]
MTSQLGRLTSLRQKKQPLPSQPVKIPLPPWDGTPPQPDQQQAPAAQAPPSMAARQDKVLATLEPVPAPLPAQREGKGHKGMKAGQPRQRQAAVQAVSPKGLRIHHAQKGAPARPDVSAGPRAETIQAPRIDTAARGALLYTARASEISGDWRSALVSYQKALKIDPGNYRIMNNLAAALNNLGMFDEGAREARRALERKPDYVPAMINAAIACSATGNIQDALRLFSTAYAADPGNRGLAINLGILQERIGRLDDALATYRRLAAAGDSQALHGMGRVYEHKGNRYEALSVYRRIVAMPDVSPTLKREVKERLARLEE